MTTPRAAFLASALDQLRELADPVVAMLNGESQSDPFLVITTTQLAAFVLRAAEDDVDLDDGEEVPPEARALAESLLDHARRLGRHRVAAAFDALDLAATCALDDDPEADPFERASRLHDLYELAFLADVLDDHRRARLIDALELATAEVLLDPERFADLLLPALELRALIYLPDDHAASILLETVITATDWLTAPPPVTDAEAQAIVASALAGLGSRADLDPSRAAPDLPFTTRLVEWLKTKIIGLADTVSPTRTPLFAASTPAASLAIARGQAHFVALLEAPSKLPSRAEPSAVSGLFVRISADPLSAGAPLSSLGVDPSSVAQVARWIGALVGDPDALDPHALDLNVALPARLDVALVGDSWQLAAALAAISEHLGHAPRGAWIASGRLGDRPGEVLAVDGVAEKHRLLAQALGPSQADRAAGSTSSSPELALIIDAARDVRPDLDHLFGPGWLDRLRDALGLDASSLARQAARAWSAFWGRRNVMDLGPRRDQAMDLADRALSANVAGHHRVDALWVRGACRLHRGETTLAAADLDEVELLIAASPPGTFEAWRAEELAAYRAVALVDRLQPEAAVALLTPALARLDDTPAPARDRGFHEVRLQVAGSLHRAQVFVGDLAAARVTLVTSLSTNPIASERARTLGDLAELERRAGDLEAAGKALALAFDALDDLDLPHVAAITRRFLVLYAKRLGLAGGLAPIALTRATSFPAPSWDRWPEPLETLEDLLTTTTETLSAWVESHVLANADRIAPIHLFVVLGALARYAALGHPVLTLARSLGAHLATRIGPTTLSRLLGTLDDGALSVLSRTTPY